MTGDLNMNTRSITNLEEPQSYKNTERNHDFWKYKSVENGVKSNFFLSIDTGWRFNNYWSNWWLLDGMNFNWIIFHYKNWKLKNFSTQFYMKGAEAIFDFI